MKRWYWHRYHTTLAHRIVFAIIPRLPQFVHPPIAVVTAATKCFGGWWAAKRAGVGPRGRRRAALSLIPRGEFSIVIAGIGAVGGIGALALIAAWVGRNAPRKRH